MPGLRSSLQFTVVQARRFYEEIPHVQFFLLCKLVFKILVVS